jgi:DNA-binding PadR family transcriptional regulator
MTSHSKRRSPNLLGLAVLGLLHESPMHPHAISVELRERGLDRSFKLKTGSLYDVVRSLETAGWISIQETVRVGTRPERTVYAPTELGNQEFIRWLDELLRAPAEEFPRFASAITYLGALAPSRAVDALRERTERLTIIINEWRDSHEASLKTLAAEQKPRLFVLEAEYAIHMYEAELAWIEKTIREIEGGTLPWPETSSSSS